MKRTIALLFAVLLAVSGVVSTANAVSVSIAVGDRPYYVHGPVYYAGPVRGFQAIGGGVIITGFGSVLHQTLTKRMSCDVWWRFASER